MTPRDQYADELMDRLAERAHHYMHEGGDGIPLIEAYHELRGRHEKMEKHEIPSLRADLTAEAGGADDTPAGRALALLDRALEAMHGGFTQMDAFIDSGGDTELLRAAVQHMQDATNDIGYMRDILAGTADHV